VCNSKLLHPAKKYFERDKHSSLFFRGASGEEGKKSCFFKHFSTKPSEHIAYKKASVLNYFLKLNSFFDIFNKYRFPAFWTILACRVEICDEYDEIRHQ